MTNHYDESLQQIVIKKDELRRIIVFLEISNLCQYSTFFNNLTRKNRHNKKTEKKKKRWKKDEKRRKKKKKRQKKTQKRCKKDGKKDEKKTKKDGKKMKKRRKKKKKRRKKTKKRRKKDAKKTQKGRKKDLKKRRNTKNLYVSLEISYLCQFSTFFNNLTRKTMKYEEFICFPRNIISLSIFNLF